MGGVMDVETHGVWVPVSRQQMEDWEVSRQQMEDWDEAMRPTLEDWEEAVRLTLTRARERHPVAPDLEGCLRREVERAKEALADAQQELESAELELHGYLSAGQNPQVVDVNAEL